MARSRRKRRFVDETDNHERWLVSYADFVTLLFAFFVVMYSISSINSEKYLSLSEALGGAFSVGEGEYELSDPTNPINIGTNASSINPIILDNPLMAEEEKQRKPNELTEEIIKERERLKRVSEQFTGVLESFIEDDLINVKKHDFWVELEMNSQLLFLSGEAELSPKAIPILKKIAEVIRRMPNVVNIEGYTDNVAINTLEFPSNWDLSSARATSVVRQLIDNGISPKRLSAVGYGEFHPVADNNSDEGRSKNRRVVLVFMSQAFARYGMSDKERSKVLNLKTSDDTDKESND